MLSSMYICVSAQGWEYQENNSGKLTPNYVCNSSSPSISLNRSFRWFENRDNGNCFSTHTKILVHKLFQFPVHLQFFSIISDFPITEAFASVFPNRKHLFLTFHDFFYSYHTSAVTKDISNKIAEIVFFVWNYYTVTHRQPSERADAAKKLFRSGIISIYVDISLNQEWFKIYFQVEIRL